MATRSSYASQVPGEDRQYLRPVLRLLKTEKHQKSQPIAETIETTEDGRLFTAKISLF